jgi:hypothetical protein
LPEPSQKARCPAWRPPFGVPASAGSPPDGGTTNLLRRPLAQRVPLRLLALALTGALLGAALSARAATTRYVDALAGNDALDGLAATVAAGHGPKATIQAAIATATPGDTIVVHPGAYPETIRFTTANLILTSLDPADPATIAATVLSGAPAVPPGVRTGVSFGSGAGPGAVLTGFTVSTGSGRGIECSGGATPTIAHCILRGSQGGMAGVGSALLCVDSAPILRNTLIYGNTSVWGCGGIELLRSSPLLLNCTLANNAGASAPQSAGSGLLCRDSSPVLRNCILWGNTDTAYPNCPQIVCLGTSAPTVSYSCVQGSSAVTTPGVVWGAGNLDDDPRFVNSASGDYRLRSTGGRWNGAQWIADDSSSPALDAGDPADDWTAESAPNGDRVNLGFDGNTPFASRSPVVPPEFVLEPAALALAEGDIASVTVSLSRAPAGPLAVTVRLEPPDAGIVLVSGQAFTLDPATWVAGATVTLRAPEDDADSAAAAAVLWVEAVGVAPASLRVTVADDDVALNVSGGTPAGTTIHERGADVPLSAQPPEHWHFVRWQGDTAGIADPLAATTSIRLDAPATVTAQCASDRHSLVIRSDYGTPQGAGEYDYGATAVWSVSSPIATAVGERRMADSAGAAVVMDADRIITVAWATECLLTAAASGPGRVETTSGWRAATTTVQLVAIPERGCHFRGWEGDLPREHSFNNPLALPMDQPHTVRACFARNPVSFWAAVTVNQPQRPGADYGWLEMSWDPAGGWQSDLSILVPPEAPDMPLAYCRAWPLEAPEDAGGGDFYHDAPGELPQDWRCGPQESTARCLVTAAPPLLPGHPRALLLSGSASGPQGLFVPQSALCTDAAVQFALYLPESLPPETTLAEFWHNGVGVALRTNVDAVARIELGNPDAMQPAALNQPLSPGAWNVITLFQWSRSDADGDGLDDGWEKLTFHSLVQTGAADADGDGLGNEAEYRLGTAAAAADSDHDSMRDGWEVEVGLDPLADDADADPDNDLSPNALEACLRTDPHFADAPRALFAALPKLASFWPLAQSFANPLGAALCLTPSGQTTFADEALRLEAAGSAAVTELPAAQAAAPARSLSLWFRSAGGGTLLSTTTALGDLPAATLRLDPLGRLSATLAGTGLYGAPAVWALDVDADAEAWHHVVLTCRESGCPVLYLDGTQVLATNTSATTVLRTLAPWDLLRVGTGSTDRDTSPALFRGQVCGLTWFTQALPADAVQQLYRAGRSLALDTLLHLDLDADGLPDGWEYAWFGGLDRGAQHDPDNDGLTLADEYRLGCNPTLPDSDGDGLVDGAEVHTHGTDPTRPDTDGDGLTDGREVNQTGSDPRRADTDGDGLADGWEVAHGLSPCISDSDGDGIADALADNDGDGFTNAAELARGTDPRAPDVGSSLVSFATPSTAVREANTVLRIGVTLAELPPGRDTVTLVVACTGGTARRGADFEFTDTAVTLSAGRLSATLEVRLIADAEPEPEETIILTLQKVCGARLGPNGTHVIRIADALSPSDDTDTDGLPDAWEMRWFSNLDQGAADDPDHDGLSNLEEYRCGTRPDRAYRAASAAELRLRVTELGR